MTRARTRMMQQSVARALASTSEVNKANTINIMLRNTVFEISITFAATMAHGRTSTVKTSKGMMIHWSSKICITVSPIAGTSAMTRLRIRKTRTYQYALGWNRKKRKANACRKSVSPVDNFVGSCFTM